MVSISSYNLYSYLQTKLSASLDDISTHLKASGYLEDQGENFDLWEKNKSLEERRNWFGRNYNSEFTFMKSDHLLIGGRETYLIYLFKVIFST